MTMKTKKELFGVEIKGYFKGSKKEKGRILDALERQTGMRRESLIRALKREFLRSVYNQPNKRGRKTYYTPDTYAALKEIWESANSCCGELLHPVIPEYIQILKRDDMWDHSDEATCKLLAMSLATVKRKVSGWKCLGQRGSSTTTPSSIKERVPIFQGSWLSVSVGMGQIDTVAHCGGSLVGDFAYTCGYVDVSSGWFQYRAQWNKGMEVTKESLEDIKQRLPFVLNHIHPDCGTEFLNQIVMSWCEKEKIEVSRSRSYHKNDNGYIEQRNGHVIRRWLGYERLGDQKLLPKINNFLDLVCLYHNHFIAQRLCIGTKTIHKGKYRKVYEQKAQTPYQRLLNNPNISEEIKNKLKIEHQKLNPKLLHDKLERMKCDILKANRLATGKDHFTDI
jgi:hypothetical protein